RLDGVQALKAPGTVPSDPEHGGLPRLAAAIGTEPVKGNLHPGQFESAAIRSGQLQSVLTGSGHIPDSAAVVANEMVMVMEGIGVVALGPEVERILPDFAKIT